MLDDVFEFYIDNECYLSEDKIQTILDYYDGLPQRFLSSIKNIKFKDENQLVKVIDKYILEHKSNFIFPNHFIDFYPQVRELKSSSHKVCNLSGANIENGEVYLSYYPFMENLSNGKVYVIQKKIISSMCYLDCLPKTLGEYEEWYCKLKNSYYDIDSDVIDFYNLSVECGDNCLEPYLLGYSKKKQKIKSI